MYVPHPKKEGDERDEPQPLPTEEDPSRVTITIDPIPICQAD